MLGPIAGKTSALDMMVGQIVDKKCCLGAFFTSAGNGSHAAVRDTIRQPLDEVWSLVHSQTSSVLKDFEPTFDNAIVCMNTLLQKLGSLKSKRDTQLLTVYVTGVLPTLEQIVNQISFAKVPQPIWSLVLVASLLASMIAPFHLS